jgi:hypothetical protein
MAAGLPYHMVAFIRAHRWCRGRRHTAVTPPTPHGYRLIELRCGCGTTFAGWATPEDDEEMLKSALVAFES